MINVIAIPAFRDNYIWCIEHDASGTCALVDPGDAAPVLKFLAQMQLRVTAILITHHHWDHVAGVSTLLKHYPVPVYGPANSPFPEVNHPLQGLQQLTLFDELTLNVIAIPGHTLDHLAYYGEQKLFCGDTLFAAGCGRLFEGSYNQMYCSLQELCKLPDDTAIYCAHEYTLANLKFAQQVDPTNPLIAARIQEVQKLRAMNKPSLPTYLALEKLINPFLRVMEPTIINSVTDYAQQHLNPPFAIFKFLRLWKDNF